MFSLKISIPSFRQVGINLTSKSTERNETLSASESNNGINKGHFVYAIEVGFLGEYGQNLERQERCAKFYRLEKRYSAFLALHNEVGFPYTHT